MEEAGGRHNGLLKPTLPADAFCPQQTACTFSGKKNQLRNFGVYYEHLLLLSIWSDVKIDFSVRQGCKSLLSGQGQRFRSVLPRI
jgi:hypothetical protein